MLLWQAHEMITATKHIGYKEAIWNNENFKFFTMTI